MGDDVRAGARGAGSPEFPATRWSLVIAAQGDDEAAARDALAEICQTYWYPLYAFARRKGLSSHDAEDRTQEFFGKLLNKDSIHTLSQEKGKLRSFLLTGMKNQLAQEWRKSSTQKRGGDKQLVFIDADTGEQRYRNEPADLDSPDALFERSWANAMLDKVMSKLSSYYDDLGKASTFETMRNYLAWNNGEKPYREAAAALGMSEGSLRFAVHRMRKRYRSILDEEIRQTVATPEEAADEMDYLRKVLSTT